MQRLVSEYSAPSKPARKPRAFDGTMRFGVFWPGTRTLLPSPQIAALNPDPLDLSVQLDLARACEHVALDLALIGDGYAPSSEEGTRFGFQDPGLHALTLAAPLIMATEHLGVISTLHSTFFHPTHIARFGANMDWLSGGRWGWNIVNGYRDYEASLFGFDTLPDSATLYDASEEAVQIIQSLWDRSRRTEFSGTHYKCHGRMKGPYPAERPVFVCAAASERGRQFTARHCDYMFAPPRGWRICLRSRQLLRASLQRPIDRDHPKFWSWPTSSFATRPAKPSIYSNGSWRGSERTTPARSGPGKSDA